MTQGLVDDKTGSSRLKFPWATLLHISMLSQQEFEPSFGKVCLPQPDVRGLSYHVPGGGISISPKHRKKTLSVLKMT